METRSTKSRVRLDTRQEDRPRIRGIAARYYDPSDRGTQFELWPGAVERIMPGAFTRSSKRDDVVALFNHDPSAVLGRRSARTLRLFNRSDGLHYVVDPPATELGRDLQESIRRGDIRGSSFGFMVRSASWIKEDGIDVRQLEEVDLVDVSPVTFPAYEATSVDVRAACESAEARTSWDVWNAEIEAEAEKRRARMRTLEARLRLAEIL